MYLIVLCILSLQILWSTWTPTLSSFWVKFPCCGGNFCSIGIWCRYFLFRNLFFSDTGCTVFVSDLTFLWSLDGCKLEDTFDLKLFEGFAWTRVCRTTLSASLGRSSLLAILALEEVKWDGNDLLTSLFAFLSSLFAFLWTWRWTSKLCYEGTLWLDDCLIWFIAFGVPFSIVIIGL